MFFRCYCYNVTIPFYRMHSVQTSPLNFFNMCKCYYVATIEPCIVMQRHSFGIFQGHCAEGYLRFKTQIKRNYNDGRTGNINSYTKVNNNTVKNLGKQQAKYSIHWYLYFTLQIQWRKKVFIRNQKMYDHFFTKNLRFKL